MPKPNKPYISLNLDRLLQAEPTEAFLGNELTLHDNLVRPINWENVIYENFIKIPIKLESTMILFFCLDGHLCMARDGKDYKIGKNDVAFIKSGIFGEVKFISRDIQFAFVAMNEDFYYPILNRFISSILQKELIDRPTCPLPEERMEECISLYNLLKNRLNNSSKDFLQKEIARGYLQALTFNVYSQYQLEINKGDNREYPQTRQKEIFNQFMELLDKNFITERKISYYANILCITPRYLSHIVKQISGHFAGHHIDLFVITEAKQLLRSKNYTVSQVSDILNFTCQSLFGRYFKKVTGYTPKEYQNLP